MIQKIITLLLTLQLLACGGGGGSTNTAPTPPAPEPAPVQTPLQQDMTTLKNTLVGNHPNPFLNISESQFDSEINRIQNDFLAEDKEQLILQLARLMAKLGDGHTYVDLASLSDTGLTLPISFLHLHDGWVINKASEQYLSILGAKVIAINGVAIDEVESRFLQYISFENRAWANFWIERGLNKHKILKGIGVLGEEIDFVLDLELHDGVTTIANITVQNDVTPQIDYFSYREFSPPTQFADPSNYWLQHFPDNSALYIQYNRCQEDPAYSIEEFTTEVVNLMTAQQPNKLIVDLRNNTGGNSQLLSPWIDSLRGSQWDDPNRLNVITGEKTYSTALLNALQFDSDTMAEFLGTETGGKPNHFGEVKSRRLANTGITFYYSNKYFQLRAADPQTLEPNVYLPLTIADFRAGVDPAFDRAIY